MFKNSILFNTFLMKCLKTKCFSILFPRLLRTCLRSWALPSIAGFPDSGTFPETYQKPIKSIWKSMISGLMASIAGFPDSGTLPEGLGQPARLGAPGWPARLSPFTWSSPVSAQSLHLAKSGFSPVTSLSQVMFQPSPFTWLNRVWAQSPHSATSCSSPVPSLG